MIILVIVLDYFVLQLCLCIQSLRFECDCARVESAVIITCVDPYRISEGDWVCSGSHITQFTGGASCEVLCNIEG